jgi:hypothetical protein
MEDVHTLVAPLRRLRADPRHGQITTLAILLGYGLGWLVFDLTLVQVTVTIGTALAVQALADRWSVRPVLSGAKSALISSLSLCLLLRTDDVVLAAAAAAVAVLSKFFIRVRGKRLQPDEPRPRSDAPDHRRGWVSPGQWGTQALLAFATGVRRTAGGAPRHAGGRDAGLHRSLRRPAVRAVRSGSVSP